MKLVLGEFMLVLQENRETRTRALILVKFRSPKVGHCLGMDYILVLVMGAE